MSHSVEDHLKLEIKDYDVAIRKLVPHYDELVDTGTAILTRFVADDATVIDLGCGTGRLSEALLKKLPRVKLELIDIDPKAMQLARERFAETNTQINFRLGSFVEKLPPSDATVASLSLHHIANLNEKEKAYANIHSALKPGGVFLCLDASICEDPRVSQDTFAQWAAHMHDQKITATATKEYFANWQKEERYFSLADELTALKNAGFTHPECFWRKGPLAIYGALKNL